MKEKSGVAGIFRAKVDGTGQKRRPQNRGRADPQPVFRRDFGLRKSEQHHVAEESAFEIELGANDNRPFFGARSRQRGRGYSGQKQAPRRHARHLIRQWETASKAYPAKSNDSSRRRSVANSSGNFQSVGKSGKREFVQVLRLMEVFKIDDVAAAVRDAIARGAVGFDAVKHLVLCRIERRPPRLDMTIYPYLPKATVATTSARSYMDLLAGVAA